MRLVGEFEDEVKAERFLNVLLTTGVEAEIRDGDGGPGVWVYDEDLLPEAVRIYHDFKKNPHDRKFDAPRAIRPKPQEPQIRFRPGQQRARYVDVRSEVFSRPSGFIPLTMGIIVICIVVMLMQKIPALSPFIRSLYFSEYMGREFPEILSGQVWRLITPMFLHGGLLHLTFNMLWLFHLGGQIERVDGARYFLLMTLVLAIFCHTAQYMVSGPLFVGMSGVVYGLLGYLWMMTRYNPSSGYMLHPQTVGIMVIWLVICLIGIIPNVANTEHVVGFVTGTVWGLLRSGGWRKVGR